MKQSPLNPPINYTGMEHEKLDTKNKTKQKIFIMSLRLGVRSFQPLAYSDQYHLDHVNLIVQPGKMTFILDFIARLEKGLFQLPDFIVCAIKIPCSVFSPAQDRPHVGSSCSVSLDGRRCWLWGLNLYRGILACESFSTGKAPVTVKDLFWTI